MTEDKRVEFIESYIKIGNSDYKWNDNHGELIRCKDCKWFTYGYCDKTDLKFLKLDDYCSRAERKEE